MRSQIIPVYLHTPVDSRVIYVISFKSHKMAKNKIRVFICLCFLWVCFSSWWFYFSRVFSLCLRECLSFLGRLLNQTDYGGPKSYSIPIKFMSLLRKFYYVSSSLWSQFSNPFRQYAHCSLLQSGYVCINSCIQSCESERYSVDTLPSAALVGTQSSETRVSCAL